MANVGWEETLSDAALRGDVGALANFIGQGPNLLDKHYLKCEDKSVLHVAAMLGNVAFFQAVLDGNSFFRHNMCLARDRDGKNPIHLAAIHGKLNILNLIRDYDWLVQAALEKTDKGGTILHLCVKHNQLDALRLLLNIFTYPGFQTAKNEDGMTILHLAFYFNQQNLQSRREVINCLIINVPRIVNLKNANEETVLDLFLREAGIGKHSQRLGKGNRILMRRYDRIMADCLIKANAKKGEDILNPYEGGLGKRRDAIMVVASLIATMAFQAMINPPGGTWQDNLLGGDKPHRVGESVMAQTHPKYYKQLMQANAVAFVSSLSIIILLVRGSAISAASLFVLCSIIMWLAVAAISVVYSTALVAIVPEAARASSMSASGHMAIIPIMVWSLIVIAFVVEFVKLAAMFCRNREAAREILQI